MELRNLALAAVLAAPVAMQFAAAQDTKKMCRKPGKNATDPVCGTVVARSDAPKTEYKGKTYYFCSIDEKREFEKLASYIKVDKNDTTKK